jgi:hypothetical protein
MPALPIPVRDRLMLWWQVYLQCIFGVVAFQFPMFPNPKIHPGACVSNVFVWLGSMD